MKRLSLLLLLVACGPIPLEEAERQCTEQARLAQQPRGTVGVVVADHFRTDRIFTLDQRDFRVIKPLTTGFDHFTILPADA